MLQPKTWATVVVHDRPLIQQVVDRPFGVFSLREGLDQAPSVRISRYHLESGLEH
jgi:hypothetical protein